MSESTYEGWKNWETWNVNLNIDNEYSWYKEKIRVITSKGFKFTGKNVRDVCESILPGYKTSDMRDVSDMNKVNWKEIADHWKLEAKDHARRNQ